MTTDDRQPRQAVVTIGSVLRGLRRRSLLILICALLGLVVGGMYSAVMKPTYEAEAIVDITPSADSGLDPKSVSTATEQRIATSNEVVSAAAKQLGVGDVDDLLNNLTVASPLNSLLITFTYAAPSPSRAAAGANAAAQAYVTYRQKTFAAQSSAREQLYQAQLTAVETQLGELRVQLAQLSDSQRSSADGRLLQARVSQLQTSAVQLQQGLDTLQTSVVSTARLVGRAARPTSASGQGRTIYLAGGLVLGLVIGALLALLRERSDDRIRDVDELSEVADAPVLVTSNRVRGDVFAMSDILDRDSAADYYRVLAVKLWSATTVRSLVIASPDAADGDVVAANLAVAFSELGVRTALVGDQAALEPINRWLSRGRTRRRAEQPAHRWPADDIAMAEDAAHATERADDPDLSTSDHHAPDVHLLPLGKDVVLPDVVDQVAALRDRFEVLVIDGEAPRRLSLTLGLAGLADAALLVARQGRTTRHELSTLVTDLRHVDVSVVGVALMKAERGRPPKQHRLENAQPSTAGPRKTRQTPSSALQVDVSQSRSS